MCIFCHYYYSLYSLHVGLVLYVDWMLVLESSDLVSYYTISYNLCKRWIFFCVENSESLEYLCLC